MSAANVSQAFGSPESKPGPEPGRPLLGRPVRQGLGVDPPLRLLLDPVVADRRRRRERLPRCRPARAGPARTPNAAQTPAKQSAWSSRRTESSLRSDRVVACDSRCTAAFDAEQVLHVVPELVGDHVGLREVARRAEPAVELAEEPEIEVHEPVGGAVERTGRGRGDPAARVGPIGEQDELGVSVRPPGGTEDVLVPHHLDVVDHRVRALRERSPKIRTGLAGGRLVRASEVGAARDVEAATGAELEREHDDDEQDHGADATTDRERDPTEASAAVARPAKPDRAGRSRRRAGAEASATSSMPLSRPGRLVPGPTAIDPAADLLPLRMLPYAEHAVLRDD